MRRAAAIAAFMVLAVSPAVGTADDNAPPGVSGFPPGYFLPCSEAPKMAVLTPPAPFDRFMRVLCTRAGHALAPPPGFHWVFVNGGSMWLSALSLHSGLTGQDAYFSKLQSSPPTAAQAAAFRARLRRIVPDPRLLEGDLLRLEVETSTGDHKQEYLFVARDASGQVSPVWGIECYHDCDPMDKQPWAFQVVRDPSSQAPPAPTKAQ